MVKRITINEIAKRAGTSKTTVSFYLNGKTDKMSEETKNKIAQVISETGYRPSVAARSLNAKSTRLIGVVIGDITNTFANQLVKGIEEFAREKKYQLIVGNSNYSFETEEMYVKRMLAMGVDGFIVQPSTKFYLLMDLIKKNNRDVVFIDSQASIDKEKWVKTNHYEVLLEAGAQLIEKGYEEYLMITANPEVLNTRMERVLGFKDALKLKGIQCNTLIVDDYISVDDLENKINAELKFGTKTLIFVANCFLLPRVYLAMKKYRNLMPETIGLFGYDNTEWTELSSPSVTTIVQPAYEEGVQATKILIDSLEKQNEEIPNQILKCSIDWQESTL